VEWLNVTAEGGLWGLLVANLLSVTVMPCRQFMALGKLAGYWLVAQTMGGV